jgi:hypothetical protein
MNKFRFLRSFTMKSIVFASLFALSLLGFTAQRSATAQSAGGSLKFVLEDDLTKTLEFNATADGEGGASGEMKFSGPVEIPDQDVDGTGDKYFSGAIEDLQLQAKFDGLVVEGNRAVMSGTITGSTVGDYIGQRVVLAVADDLVVVEPRGEDGEGGEEKKLDTLTWGIYKPIERNWVPSDAELEFDDGAKLTWWATDAEREDDKGIPSHPSTDITAKSFTPSSFAFEFKYAEGDIVVRP